MRPWCSTPGGPPKTLISPRAGRTMSRIMRIVVVLPEPLGPRKPSTSPGRTSKERSATTSVSPKRFQTPRTSTAVSVARLSGAVAWVMA